MKNHENIPVNFLDSKSRIYHKRSRVEEQIPAMDLRRGTLQRLLESLDENNEQLGWNMYRNKRGRIIVKICYDDETNLDLHCESTGHSHQTVSFKKKTTKEVQRNHLRAQNFRDNIQPAKRPRNSSPEIVRQNSDNSNPSPIQNIDISKCEEEARCESTHDLSASSEYFEMESAKPVVEIKHSSVTPELPVQKKTSSMPKDQKHRDHASKKSQSPHSKEKSNISKDPKRFTWEFSNPEYCQIGWCAIGQLRTGCTCTEEFHPCTYCIDEPSVFNKLCDRCKDRFYCD